MLKQIRVKRFYFASEKINTKDEKNTAVAGTTAAFY